MDTLLLTKLAAELLLPPGLLVVLLLGGAVLSMWRRRAGIALMLIAAGMLYVLSVAPLAAPLLAAAENVPALLPDDARLADVQAIVVLGGGRRDRAPEYGDGPTVSARTLERLRYGAWLQRASGLPLAVSGGVVFGPGPPEAELMAGVLREEFAVPVRWVEARSRNTEQNATYTAALLVADGIRHIALVSDASHLPRAAAMFRDQGLAVVPAPTAWISGDDAHEQDAHEQEPSALDWLPGMSTLARSRSALHGLLGLAWYRLRH